MIHGADLVFQRLGGRRVLLDQRRVLLRYLVDLRQRLADLLDAAGLLGAGIGTGAMNCAAVARGRQTDRCGAAYVAQRLPLIECLIQSPR